MAPSSQGLEPPGKPGRFTKTVTVDGPLPGTGDALVSNFSAAGDLVSVTNSRGQKVSYSAYNKLGEPGHIVGANGETIDYTYDARGRLTDIRTYPNGVAADALYTYDAAGQLVATTAPDGFTQNYVYDSTRRLTAVWSGTGSAQQERDFTYDPMGDVTSTQDHTMVGRYREQCFKWWRDGEGINECIDDEMVWVPAGTVTRTTSRTFDALGRLWTIGGNNGQNVQTSYDVDDNPTAITDSLNHTTRLAYDAFDRVTQSVDATVGVTQFTYDAGDNVTSVTDPKGLVTTYVHDGFGQLWAQSSPDTGTTTFTYDASGQRTGMTRADGSVTTYTHDALGRLTGVTAGGQTQTFAYDSCTHGAGRLCSVSDGQGSLTNTYTPEGWLASQTSTVAGTAYTTTYARDALGRPTAITYPDGVVANYAYANGKPATLTVTVNGVTRNVVTGLTYEPFGPADGWTYGNGLVRGNDYDLDGRLIGISTTAPSNSAVLQRLTYGHDANDAITAITNGVSSSLTQSFGYDALTRLTSVSSPSGNTAWTFDGNGNRMNQTTSTSSVAYAIASSSNRMLAAGARGFGFDALGNLTADSGNAIAYHYDPFNRMDSSTKAGVTTTYHVNPLGQRTEKATAGGSWSSFVYGADGPLLAENGPAGATDYLWLGGSLVGMVRNGALYAIHTDHLGRPELVTDANRNVVWRASNFAYDRTVTQDHIGGLNVGFPGQYFDQETGLWNNGFRDYDASLGRYVESDPLGLYAGVNTYGYVGGNPINESDPLGLMSKCAALKALIKLDQASSGPSGVLFSADYNYGSFTDPMLSLDRSYDSTGGPVNIDWMLRDAFGGLGRSPVISEGIYLFGKMFWNSINRTSPLRNIDDPAHANSAFAASAWLNGKQDLATMFAPALKQCACGK